MPDLKPFLISGLALGSVYALSGVGMVVLYRTTGVLNFAYGAIGAVGAMVAWQLVQDGTPDALAYVVAVLLGALIAGAYGAVFGPLLAPRDAAPKAIATLGLALLLLGALLLRWDDELRSLRLVTEEVGFSVFDVRVTGTQVAALGLAAGVTAATATYLRLSRTGTAMQALAGDRELTAMLGVRVRRVELLAWVTSGALAGVTGLLLAALVATEPTTLTFLVISSLAAAVIGGFRSLPATLVGGLAVGVLQAVATPFASITQYRNAAPFVAAIVVLLVVQGRGDRRTAIA